MASLGPVFTYPSEWSDEDRMYYLIAPFPPDTRPTLSDSKVTFWRTLIFSSSRDLCKYVFTMRELLERLQWRGMQPKGLDTVIELMERVGEVRKMSSYRLSEEGGWVEWGVAVVSSPLSWAWKRYMSNNSSAQENEEYVIVAFVKVTVDEYNRKKVTFKVFFLFQELAEKMFTDHLKRVTNPVTDSVVAYSDFEESCRNSLSNPSTQTCKAVEFQLIEDKLIRKAASKDGQVSHLTVPIWSGRSNSI